MARDKHGEKAKVESIIYYYIAENDNCLEYEELIALSDAEVRVLIKRSANVATAVEIQTMQKSQRDALLREIIQGISTGK